MSLLAEEIANGTLKLILSKLSDLPLNLFRFPRWIILFTHDLTRSPLHSTWVTRVERRRTAKGTFVLNLRTGSFYCGYKYPSTAFLTHLLRSNLTSPLELQNPSATATSSSPERKSFTASTSSPTNSRRPWKSSPPPLP